MSRGTRRLDSGPSGFHRHEEGYCRVTESPVVDVDTVLSWLEWLANKGTVPRPWVRREFQRVRDMLQGNEAAMARIGELEKQIGETLYDAR